MLKILKDFLHNSPIFGEGLAAAAGLAERTCILHSKMRVAKRFATQARNENYNCTRSILFVLVLLVMVTACGRGTSPIIEEYIQPEIPITVEAVQGFQATIESNVYPESLLPDIPTHNEYIISLEVDPETRTVQGISRINFTNRSGVPLDTIVLRVFLNAFNEGAYPRPYTSDLELRMHRPGSGRGYMVVEHVSLNNEALDFDLDTTVLTLNLATPLEPESTVQLLLQYSAYVPMLGHIMGGNDDAMWFGMFLPMLAVHGEHGWYTDAFYPVGSPFFFETANFHVSVQTPIRYHVVGSGHRVEELVDDTRITRFTTMARDFAFVVLSPYYSQASILTANGVEINFHYNSDGANRRVDDVLEMARRSMEYFEFRVGIYPFGQVDIVEVELLHNSVAFSQIIFADTRHIQRGNFVELSHSLGNQWFSGIVGTNSVAEPWLDNGLTHFVQAGISHYTPELLDAYMRQSHDAIANRVDLYIAEGLSAYTRHSTYAEAQGRKAMLMIYYLQRRMGDDAFWAFVNQYYQEFSFQIATGEDFIRMAEEAYGDSLEDFFDAWITRGTVPAFGSRWAR